MARLKKRLTYILKLKAVILIGAVLLSRGFELKAAAADFKDSGTYMVEAIADLASTLAETNEDEYEGFLIGVHEGADTTELENNGLEYVAEGIYKAADLNEISACINNAYIQADDVEYIEPNYYVELMTDDNLMDYNVLKSIYDSGGAYGQMKAFYTDNLGMNGEGVRVAVIDTGLNPDFNDFDTSRVICDTIFSDRKTYDGIEHGTLVADVIAGVHGNELGVDGIAPKAEIVAIKVMLNGSGTVANIINGIELAIDKYNCDIINISLGTDKTNEIQAFQEAIDRAVNKGVIVVAAAGNIFNFGGNAVSYPAACNGVISVAGVNADYTWNTGSCFYSGVDCAAMWSLVYKYNGALAHISGTSFAAPAVAAAAAIMKQAYPALTPAMFESLLKNTCLDLGDSGHDIYYGWGFVKLDMLLTMKTMLSKAIYDESSMLINIFLQYADSRYIDYSTAVAVKYSSEGRLHGIKNLTTGGSFSLITSADEKVKLFFLNGSYQPVTDYILLAG